MFKVVAVEEGKATTGGNKKYVEGKKNTTVT